MVIVCSLLSVFRAQAATITAASCSRTDVGNAVNAASDGDRVVGPAGTCAWTWDEVVTAIFITSARFRTLPVEIWEQVRQAVAPDGRRGVDDAAPRDDSAAHAAARRATPDARPVTTVPSPVTGADRPALVLRDLRKVFAGTVAVDGVDLEVRRGEFVTLLGPSGSGKTTTLRMIAGFMSPTGGSIEIDGKDMTRVPPYRRDVGMVFQSYALFPQMTAAQNVAFPLRMRKQPKSEIDRRVADVLELVQLRHLGDHYPRQLSGGQQQRIALARAVVFQPHLLLMDEPLSALDRKLRGELQLDIIRISREVGATVLYVTHDQEEALVMSDRIAIFNEGRIQQLGSGEDLYDRPASVFVADFVGESTMLRGRYEADDAEGGWIIRGQSRWRIRRGAAERAGLRGGAAAALVVRPERTRIVDAGTEVASGTNVVDATVGEVLNLGPETRYELTLDGGERLAVREPRRVSGRARQRGDAVRLTWAVDDGHLVADQES